MFNIKGRGSGGIERNICRISIGVLLLSGKMVKYSGKMRNIGTQTNHFSGYIMGAKHSDHQEK